MAAHTKRKNEDTLHEISKNEALEPPVKHQKAHEDEEEDDDDMIGPIPEQEVKPKKAKGVKQTLLCLKQGKGKLIAYLLLDCIYLSLKKDVF